MNELLNFWNLILESNAFNFVVLIVILIIAAQKLHLSELLENMKDEIIKSIEKAKLAKSKAEHNLNDAKAKIEHIEDEIVQKLTIANSRAHNVGETIKENAQRKLKQIADNAEKIIDAEEKTIYTSLNDEAALAAVQLAEQLIREKLQQNPKLHDKFITDCIEEIERVVL